MSELFIIGAQRSGTTYLYEKLAAHPQVCMANPVRPEPKHFLDKDLYSKGKEYYETRYFKRRLESHKYIGEKSTSYIEHKSVAERIRSFYPKARILVILRDPVERAYSNFRFSVENDIEFLPFGDALAAESKRLLAAKYDTSVNPYAYQQRGHYVNYLNNYTQVFDRSQIHVLIHEEFISDSKAIANLYAWLGIDPDFLPDRLETKVNKGAVLPADTSELQKSKCDLYEKFVNSNEQLEKYLGRKIDVWRY